ncbi:hypothetical protein RHMOL_Rhmol10G0000900 [Rhododendron molle]|uniref:Uncharacterized protein n=1 Tax=Rhododendron molle TaxID=49168 RepID=A0ACC0LX79_RHOML|nr:hypothetical protein RHMOL_Rhmol10G0000900 [Rhododendron molle]
MLLGLYEAHALLAPGLTHGPVAPTKKKGDIRKPLRELVPCVTLQIQILDSVAEVAPKSNVNDSCSNLGRCCRSRGIGGDGDYSNLVRLFHNRSAGRTSETESSDPSVQVGRSVGVELSLREARHFEMEELALATKSFSDRSLIGEGKFGAVYKGLLNDGMLVAIKKRAAAPSQEFIEEFLEETQREAHLERVEFVSPVGSSKHIPIISSDLAEFVGEAALARLMEENLMVVEMVLAAREERLKQIALADEEERLRRENEGFARETEAAEKAQEEVAWAQEAAALIPNWASGVDIMKLGEA